MRNGAEPYTINKPMGRRIGQRLSLLNFLIVEGDILEHNEETVGWKVGGASRQVWNERRR